MASFSQLVQELIHGSVRRHTFTKNELELLFDLKHSRLRKSSRPEVLRRYLRAVQQQWNVHGVALRLSTFLEQENGPKTTTASPAGAVTRQLASLPHAG